jgi:hypothetical protein
VIFIVLQHKNKRHHARKRTNDTPSVHGINVIGRRAVAVDVKRKRHMRSRGQRVKDSNEYAGHEQCVIQVPTVRGKNGVT